MTLAGLDGCAAEWLGVVLEGRGIRALIAKSIEEFVAQIDPMAIVAVDIPIGLPEKGARSCDLEARQILRKPRSASVFPASVWRTLKARNYSEASRLHRQAEGRGMTKQVYCILRKVREVNGLLASSPTLRKTIREVHPELSFALWNGGVSMAFRKGCGPGREEREALIEKRWPGQRAACVRQLSGQRYRPDDLNDAFAALWTAERISQAKARLVGSDPAKDRCGLRMEIWA
jgi:predicted RNase H-like nuclease